ncbi:hypothetical protein VTP01DRAFT_3033 [Rhizomucor pusillus]|uniref:uncharacterized protein n=1 Tax=Rhizomucor pusillus TaxID=4840 RepID=UPI0037426F55
MWRRCLSTLNYSDALKRTRLKHAISVAPMVDITNAHFLELLHIVAGQERYAYYTEMHPPHVITKNPDTLYAILGAPRPNVVVQLGGSDPQHMAQAAEILERQGYSEININVGCPSAAVKAGDFGAVLMKTPEKVVAVLREMQSAVSIPITVKCRLGVDDLDTYEFLHRFVDTIISQSKRELPHLIVHARKCILKGLTPKQNRNVPQLNYDRVYRLAQDMKHLPISINGGFKDPTAIQDALQRVDGCMIGRQIMNNPLFLQTLDTTIYNVPNKSVLQVIREYIDYGTSLESHPAYSKHRLPPLTILTKPLTMMFGGQQGRAFRRELQQELRRPEQGLDRVVTNALVNAGILLSM